MIKINLFPFRAAKIKENIRRQVTVYSLSVVFLILLLGVFPYNPYSYLSLDKKLKSLREEKDDKEKDLDKFKDITVKIKKLDEDKADLKVKLKTIKDLEKGKAGPVKLLDDIAMSVPRDKLWLTRLAEEKGKLTLEGTAMDNETVADFMDRLKGTDSVTSVELVRTRQKNIKELDLNLKDFALNCKTYAFKEKPPPEVKKKRRRRKK